MDMKLVLPVYNVHHYFSLKNLGKKCTLYMSKYGTNGASKYMKQELISERRKTNIQLQLETTVLLS